MILCDYTALVAVTDEMRKLRRCPECDYKGYVITARYRSGVIHRGPCPECNRTLVNPDQSKWWEALENAEFEESLCKILLNIPMEKITFCEAPSGRCGANLIHRPSGDNRPWPVVLKELIELHCHKSDIAHVVETAYLNGWKLVDISFALATPETAPVFKSFGIKTLVEA